ncbi:hypothetical protein H112_06637 [Trichophyton rubrum D6]|uniref:Uncharacterized protein n=2 Tax=Trichophyton TaxID=5550 RepID=A0A022VUK6_TRIRU|nr:hypothetical protein H100_06654 [Trichophyton rubrum MR850]EZF39286.1 hypothetical protein H102_06621 [Trichophyton rubrum CBS 100081]EZF49932.1 hypothetical protein H103_06645 [Trichophyton rubrum CBS 288.86]EZF60568.1 hypothetical protein H104_06600 [Trichophyton rubrum CBS 289.86]EZF71026.1 hypothetical protein H105_06658 [Trichophyton soudanense CBS 452.61]EZF81761.1 hypothetical protein H110_06642 [Trichophyton rubrum MR1448]EZF92406.1 hypothetical protein H113_06691 [Trichophyton rub
MKPPALEKHTVERAAVAREEYTSVETPPGQNKAADPVVTGEKAREAAEVEVFRLFAATRKGEERQKVVASREKCVEEEGQR